MEGPCHQFLPGAAFAIDQNSNIGGGDLDDSLAKLLNSKISRKESGTSRPCIQAQETAVPMGCPPHRPLWSEQPIRILPKVPFHDPSPYPNSTDRNGGKTRGEAWC